MRTAISFLLLIVSFPLLATATEPAAQSPELEVLAQRAGAWNVAADFRPAEWTPDGERFEETKTSEWILNGQFLEETVLSNKHEARVLFGYDKTRNVYRSWYFRDNGVTDDWTGTWDEQNTTMTWKGVCSGSPVGFATAVADCRLEISSDLIQEMISFP